MCLGGLGLFFCFVIFVCVLELLQGVQSILVLRLKSRVLRLIGRLLLL